MRLEKQEKLEGEPWYKEVQELRKVANDYKVIVEGVCVLLES